MYEHGPSTAGHKTTWTMSRSWLLILYWICKFDTVEQLYEYNHNYISVLCQVRLERSTPYYLGYRIKTTIGFRLKQWFLCISWTEIAVSSSGQCHPLPEHTASTIHTADTSLSVPLMLMSRRKKLVILIQSMTGTSDFSINNLFYYKFSLIFIDLTTNQVNKRIACILALIPNETK